ncbi:MAG: lipopolysaccharide biosynthesis protein [Prevotellaceae bacterium]|jgi:O-antigen/teichoic acid export membrane protein|nr:lipopolysaccharide biosynthesis protein [Prevotellaceae bacterium]
MEEPSLKEKTAKGLFWGGLSNGVQQIIGAAFGIVIARILSPGDYGLVGMLAIFTAIANIIMESGFTSALTNKKEIRHEDYNAVFWFSLLAGVVMYVLLFFCAPLIARFYRQPELINLSRFVFLNFLVYGTAIAHHAIMFKKLMVKERAKIDIVSVLISGLVGLVLALNGFAYWGLAIQTLSFTVIGVILRWYYSPWKPTFAIDFRPLKEMIGFSFKLFLTNMVWQISNNVFSVILGKFYNEKQVGYYSQGNKWMILGYMTIGGMISSVAQPVFVESNGDKARQLMIFRKMLRFGALVSFPAMLGLAFIGKEFILMTIGEKWLESVPILQLLCIWGAVAYISTLYTFLLMSFGKSDIFLYGNIGICILQLACVAVMFPFGILPMIGAYVACYFISILLWHYFANKLIGIRLRHVLKDILPYLFITAGCFFVAWLVTRGIQNLYLLCALKITITAILYILVMKYSRSAIFKESVAFLLGHFKKVKME